MFSPTKLPGHPVDFAAATRFLSLGIISDILADFYFRNPESDSRISHTAFLTHPSEVSRTYGLPLEALDTDEGWVKLKKWCAHFPRFSGDLVKPFKSFLPP